jgi:hypothetical protein
VSRIDVRCEPAGNDWVCAVTVREGGSSTEHRVGVALADLAELAPGASDPTDLVRDSVAFLLEREPKESILRSFDLPLIGRYFPEYRRTIQDRMMRGDV